jgi:transcriptional regulator
MKSTHYGKASRRLLSKIRNGYSTYLRELATTGTPADIVEYVNNISVKMDVETLLGTELTESQATYLLQTPEETSTLVGPVFGQAHMMALNLKHARQALRTMLREHRMTEIQGKLLEAVSTVEFYAK